MAYDDDVIRRDIGGNHNYATNGDVIPDSTSNNLRNQVVGAVQGSSSQLWAYTDKSKYYIMGKLTAEEGHLLVHSSGKSFVTLGMPLLDPVHYDSGLFRHIAKDYSPRYEDVVLDVETQRKLVAAGVNTVDGVPIPKNPTTEIRTGGKVVQKGSITDSGIFAEGSGANEPELEEDKRFYVRTRVPDSVNYHYERQRNDSTIPFLDKMHAQYQRPIDMTDSEFESQLARARFLSGMEPYLSNREAKHFEHFTYWRYKNTPTANPFRGAYIHAFLSRPDLHLLDRFSTSPTLTYRSDVLGNRELASLIFLNPEGAMSLIGRWQTKAMTDINLFLSNRLCGLQMSNENVDDHSFTENFTRINVGFGGRMDNQEGDIDLTFSETDDLSVSNTILLWMKYIHMTFTGKLSPLCNGQWQWNRAYNMLHHHPIWRRLDSLASLYVIATDVTQHNIIFWRKYFGVYPKSSAFAGLGMEQGKMSEGIRQVNIPFHYTTFRTNDFTDLYAFNRLSDLSAAISGANSSYANDAFQVKDMNVINDHNMIAGLPFVALENHVTTTTGEYNKMLPEKMVNPLLLFTQTDGAFMPNGSPTQMYNWVNRYWGGVGSDYSLQKGYTSPVRQQQGGVGIYHDDVM